MEEAVYEGASGSAEDNRWLRRVPLSNATIRLLAESNDTQKNGLDEPPSRRGGRESPFDVRVPADVLPVRCQSAYDHPVEVLRALDRAPRFLSATH